MSEGMNNLPDLSKKSAENIEYMITAIQEKLHMINSSAMKADHFNAEAYDDLHDLYEMVLSKERFSPSEMQAIVEELGNMRK